MEQKLEIRDVLRVIANKHGIKDDVVLEWLYAKFGGGNEFETIVNYLYETNSIKPNPINIGNVNYWKKEIAVLVQDTYFPGEDVLVNAIQLQTICKELLYYMKGGD